MMAKHSFIYRCISRIGCWCESKGEHIKCVCNKKNVMRLNIGITATVFLLLIIYINTNQLSEHYQLKVNKQLKPPSHRKHDSFDQQLFTLHTTENSSKTVRLITSSSSSFTTKYSQNRTPPSTNTKEDINVLPNNTQIEKQAKNTPTDLNKLPNNTEAEKQIKNPSYDSNSLPNNTEAEKQIKNSSYDSNSLLNKTEAEKKTKTSPINSNTLPIKTEAEKQTKNPPTESNTLQKNTKAEKQTQISPSDSTTSSNKTQAEKQIETSSTDSNTLPNKTEAEKQTKTPLINSNTLPNKTEAEKQTKTPPTDSNTLQNNTKAEKQTQISPSDSTTSSNKTQAEKQIETSPTDSNTLPNKTEAEKQTKTSSGDLKTLPNNAQVEKQIETSPTDLKALPNDSQAGKQSQTSPTEPNSRTKHSKKDQQNITIPANSKTSHYSIQTGKQNITTISNEQVLQKVNIPYSTEARTCPHGYQQNHFMRVSPTGRTGNVMFEIITLLATARSYCYTPLIGSFKDELGLVLDLNFTDVLNINHTKEFKSFGHMHCSFTNKITQLDSNYNWTMVGYFQSYMFFNHYEKYIKYVIQFTKHITTSVYDFVISNGLNKGMLISVHVRRGDFTNDYFKEKGYTEAPAEYIFKSMKYFNNKYKQHEINYIFLSDDITWCKQNFNTSRRVYFSPFGASPYKLSAGQDLALMRMCNHSIITSGSFSWIGAWLSGGDVIYYDGFPRPGSWLATQYNLTEYYLPHWLGMNENTTITV